VTAAPTAVVLVGGEGTRLRPLTERTPKPMLPLVDRPLLAYTFEHLRRHGVGRVILSCGYLPTAIERHFGASADGIPLEYRVEPEPLGTGGAIRFAAEGIEEPFLAVNGDTLRAADLGKLLELHRDRGARATVLLTPVADPSRYGLVRVHEDGRVRAFLEKPRPEEIDTNLINAGVYVLEPSVLELIPSGRPVSIEREVFPRLVEEGTLYALASGGYWLDVGTPESYLQAHRDVLERSVPGDVGAALGSDYTFVDPSAHVAAGARLIPPVFVGAGAVVGEDARVGSLAVVAAGVHVGRACVIEHAVVQSGARIGDGTVVLGSIVGPEADVGADCELTGLVVVGPGARVGERNRLGAGLTIGAGAEIPPAALAFP
jgi:mannose-1-phosphate guanylyltransferase